MPTIDIDANTRAAQKNLRDLARAYEDVEDAVEDLGRGGARDLDQLEDSLQRVERAGGDVGDAMERGFDKAKRGADDFKSEANQTARESAASFDGSAESIGDAFQEVAANAFAGFGPAGALAGTAVAAGIGAAVTAFQGLDERSEESKQRVSQNFTEMAETGIDAWEGMEAYNKRLSEAYAENSDQIQKIADTIALPFEVVAAAYAGNAEALNAVRTANDEYAAAVAAGQKTVGTAMEGAIAASGGLIKPIEDLNEEYAAARQRAEQYFGQIDADAQAANQQIGATANLLRGMPQPPPVSISVDTSPAYRAVDALRRDLQSRGITVPIRTTGLNSGATWE